MAGPGALILIAGRAVSLCFCTSWVFFRSAFVTTGFRCHEERVKRATDVDVATGATVLLLMLSSRRTNESFVSRPLSTNDSSGECCAGYSLRSSFARTMPERISVGPRIAAERSPAWPGHADWARKGAHCCNGCPQGSVLRCVDADVLLGPAERLAKVLRQTPSSITGHQPPLALRQQGRYMLCSPFGCRPAIGPGARWGHSFR